MKICKNDFDIILYPVSKCSQCVLRVYRSSCLWLKIGKSLMNCGSIRADVLSDIFKL